MALCQEQLATSSHYFFSPRVRRWVKNQMNRRLRRAARRDPENAPVKRQYRGWP